MIISSFYSSLVVNSTCCLLTFYEENFCKRHSLTVADVLGFLSIWNAIWLRNSRCLMSRKLSKSQDCRMDAVSLVNGLMSPLSVGICSNKPE